MLLNLVLVFSLLITNIYVCLLIYSKSFWLNSIHKENSVTISLNQSEPAFNFKKREQEFIKNLGYIVAGILPAGLIESSSKDLIFLARKPEELYRDLGLMTICLLALISCFFVSRNYIYLVSLLILLGLVFTETKIAVKKAESNIENNLDHLVKCLKILIVKTETPLITALELINQDLAPELNDLKRELTKLIERGKKSGIKKTLVDWDTNLEKFQNLISLLISIHEGASKTAIEENIKKFLQKYQEEKNEALKSQAENLQLYLIIPVILMLITSLMPMVDAINFYMKHTGVL